MRNSSSRESWDEEAAETLIESLPIPAVELATKQDLRAEMAEVRSEIANLRAEMIDRIGALRAEM